MILLDIGFSSLHTLLRGLYDDMLPLCDDLTGIAKGIAGIGALLYVSYRVWQSLARAEEIDVFPLLRPFAIGICIMFFPNLVLGTVNGVLSPVVVGCHQILEDQVFDMNEYQKQKDKAEMQAFAQTASNFVEENADYDEKLGNLGWTAKNAAIIAGMNKAVEFFSFRAVVIKIMRAILEFIFEVAALIIDTIRTFFLIVLAILGPLSFAISVFDGFHHTLVHWLCRYISVYLWLPISDLFSAMLSRIQVLTLQYDLENIDLLSQGTSSLTYLLFLAIGIAGYFSIPTVAGWVIQCGGMGSFLKNANSAGSGAGKAAGAAVGAATGNPAGLLIH